MGRRVAILAFLLAVFFVGFLLLDVVVDHGGPGQAQLTPKQLCALVGDCPAR